MKYDQSTKTKSKPLAEMLRTELESEHFKRAIYGSKGTACFAEAASGYMTAGGSSLHMKPLLLRIGGIPLNEIKQTFIDELALEMKPDAKPATRIRQVYTPISAVMQFAVENDLIDKFNLRKPKVEDQRLDFLMPHEVEQLLKLLPPHLRDLVIFYLATGCRATEALDLEWRDVAPGGERCTFWWTKKRYPRSVDLGARARAALPPRLDDPSAKVWRSSDGEPWAAYAAINRALKRICQKKKVVLDPATGKPKWTTTKPSMLKTAHRLERTDERQFHRDVHLHLFRHTWATWAYACTRDLTYLMATGGWRTPDMVMRYAHPASDSLAREVLAHGWEFAGKELPGLRCAIMAQTHLDRG